MDEKRLDELRQARAAALNFRPAAVDATHAAGRLTARERIAGRLDEGSFVECGVLAEADPDDPGGAADDGVVAGAGEIDGQPIVVASYSGREGSQSDRNMRKLARVSTSLTSIAGPPSASSMGRGRVPG